MYRYFREMNDLDHFETYLKRDPYDQEKTVYLQHFEFLHDLEKDLPDLFERIKILIIFIETIYEEIGWEKLSPYDDQMTILDFLARKKERYPEIKDLEKNLTFSSCDFCYELYEYRTYCTILINIYPNYKEFLEITISKISNILEKIEKKSTMVMPFETTGICFTWPNSWYITPNGYLYNTGAGHQQGNLVYSFEQIYNSLKNNKPIPIISNNQYIQEIRERGYITQDDFRNYANLIYDLPTIMTTETRQEKRSYQSNLITLIIGHLAAEKALFSSFARMNSSNHKGDLLEKLRQWTFDNHDDILVRYAGFHKLCSVEKTITTSSLNGISQFSEYLKQGWNLDIIPGITYDALADQISEVNFHSYFIGKYLEKQLKNAPKQVRILMKK